MAKKRSLEELEDIVNTLQEEISTLKKQHLVEECITEVDREERERKEGEDRMKNEPWRQYIKRGDAVDVHDLVEKWYTARVMDVRDDGCIYISYDGWFSKYDEWIPVHSTRIQPLYSRATGGKDDYDYERRDKKKAVIARIEGNMPEEILYSRGRGSVKIDTIEGKCRFMANQRNKIHCLSDDNLDFIITLTKRDADVYFDDDGFLNFYESF